MSSLIAPGSRRFSVAACLVLALLGAADPSRAQQVTEFPVPTAVSNPFGVAAGPDGNVWFTESNSGKVGRITPAGVITEFQVPGILAGLLAIVSGPDGALWFTGGLFRITTAGVATKYGTFGGQFLTTGPDGNLWLTGTPNKIARVSPSDPNTVAVFTGVLPATTFGGVTAGPDGNVWFTETDHASKTARVARIDLTKLDGCAANPSLCITEWTIPGENSDTQLTGITLGPDGAVWFTSTGKVNRITPGGVLTQFSAASASTQGGITLGADGALWYAGTGGKIGRITTSGALTEIFVSAGFTSPRQIAAGPDGNIWFTEINANKIGRVTTGVAPGCVAAVNTLCLNNGRFKVTVAWRVPSQGTSGAGNAVALTGDTGYFWFFSANNVELIVKVVDGRALNNRFWVFFGALSNVEYTITVTDTLTGSVKTYSNSSGDLTSASDTDAFPGLVSEPPDIEAASPAVPADRIVQSLSGADAGCTPDSTTLCLNGGRFQVRVEWSVPPQGTSGAGMATAITGDTGHFWFFSSNNIELIVKLVDGRAVNNKFWFFSGALTNVAYTITITDTQTGAVKTYTNPFGTQVSLADTSAF